MDFHDPSSRPERIEGGLILVEEMGLDDLTIPNPHQEEVAALVSLIGSASRRGRNGDRLGVTG
jgi:hypothetical protein